MLFIVWYCFAVKSTTMFLFYNLQTDSLAVTPSSSPGFMTYTLDLGMLNTVYFNRLSFSLQALQLTTQIIISEVKATGCFETGKLVSLRV